MELDDWLGAVTRGLDLGDLELDDNAIHTLLDLARDTAHEVERVAAPLTSYLIGVAVGRGAPLGGVAAQLTALLLANRPDAEEQTPPPAAGD